MLNRIVDQVPYRQAQKYRVRFCDYLLIRVFQFNPVSPVRACIAAGQLANRGDFCRYQTRLGLPLKHAGANDGIRQAEHDLVDAAGGDVAQGTVDAGDPGTFGQRFRAAGQQTWCFASR